jgi:hypothetical protein
VRICLLLMALEYLKKKDPEQSRTTFFWLLSTGKVRTENASEEKKPCCQAKKGSATQQQLHEIGHYSQFEQTLFLSAKR